MPKIIPPPPKAKNKKKLKAPGGSVLGGSVLSAEQAKGAVAAFPGLGSPAPAKTVQSGLAVYVHVPFCRSKCRYCAFHSQVMDVETLEVWLDTTIAEAQLWSRRLNKPRTATLYLGGGTPSLLPGWAAEKLMRALSEAFPRIADAEVTLEANPDSVDRSSMRDWMDFGVNRVSLGVQSLEDEELAWLGRPHTQAQAFMAVAAARDAGMANLGLDLIWGLPGQTQTAWLRTLKSIVSLRPDHLSCYGLTLEPDTPLAREHEEQGLNLPGEDEQAKLYMAGGEYLQEHGLIQYEIANYARLGYESRHNSGYWTGRDYLGLGPGATSTMAGRRWTGPKNMAAWAAGVRSGKPEAGAEILDEATRLREHVMLALRTAKGLPLKSYRDRAGRDFLPTGSQRRRMVEALVGRGLARMGQGHVKLTRRGMLVSDAIIARLLDD